MSLWRLTAAVLLKTHVCCDGGVNLNHVFTSYFTRVRPGSEHHIMIRCIFGYRNARPGALGYRMRYPRVHAGAGVCALTLSRRGPTRGVSLNPDVMFITIERDVTIVM